MGFLLRNWQLKIAAIALATVLYTGLVFSGSFTEDVVAGVRIEGLNPTAEVVLLGPALGAVDVRYRAAPDTAEQIGVDSFAASIDLGTFDRTRPAQPQTFSVSVRSLIPGVDVQGWTPRQVTVTLDEIATKQVPVEVDAGDLPEGLEAGRPRVSDEQVTARGASSLIARVDRAVAPVSVLPSAVDVTDQVTLIAVGVDGERIDQVELTPAEVTVEIDVRALETTKTVPVRPSVSGTPAAGFALTGLTTEPAVVTLRGLPDDLADVVDVPTEPISLDGLAGDESFEVALTLPPGTRLEGPDAEIISVSAVVEPSVTSRTFVVGVVCQGAGENACLPGLGQVSITLSGAASLLAGLTAGQITPVVDVSGLAPGQHQVELSVSGLPAGVQLESIAPGTVPVTIEAPATPAPTAP